MQKYNKFLSDGGFAAQKKSPARRGRGITDGSESILQSVVDFNRRVLQRFAQRQPVADIHVDLLEVFQPQKRREIDQQRAVQVQLFQPGHGFRKAFKPASVILPA